MPIMNSSKQISLAGFLVTLSGAIFFSTKAIFVKLAFQSTKVDALTLLSLRMLFSLPFYLVIGFIAWKKEGTKHITQRQWILICMMGVLGYYLSSLFDFIGLQFVSAGLERLILFLYPTFAVLINTYFFKTKLNTVQIIALILTYVGIGIAYWGEMKLDTAHPNFFYGSFMIFLCAITYSFYLVGTGRIVPKVGTTHYTVYAMLFATAGIFIHFLFTKNISSIHFTSTLINYSVALAIVATVLPSFMMSFGMKHIGSNNVAIITSVGPVSTILQAHFFLGEKIIPLQLIGTSLVIIGVILIGWKSRNIMIEPAESTSV
jgi:drug/metabolite transporter (DMT)-like permease